MDGFNVECIVADGGSTDETVQLAETAGAWIVRCAQGRGAQMNAGAAAASGEILLFLHADTELPDNWDFIIRSALKDPDVALGAFRFQVKDRLRGIRLVEWGTNLRSRLFRMPYGDQGFFLRRETFDRIGGFPDQPILEDVELVRRARRAGKVITLPEAARTSGRRWRRLGVFRTTFRNQLILLGAALGVPLRKLRIYYG
jgi:rSAM/selenodomain-associated transferase 2